MAKARGAFVIGTASLRNHPLLRMLGADQSIDYAQTRFEDVARNVDMVLDTIGGETQARSWTTLREDGILVSITDPPSEQIAAAHGMRQARPRIRPNAAHLAAMAELCESGKMKPVINAIFALEQARSAHESIETGHTAGKIVLRVGEE
jgi:NADPH:quinone reductase-like Zn-dependent oxidoreductase